MSRLWHRAAVDMSLVLMLAGSCHRAQASPPMELLQMAPLVSSIDLNVSVLDIRPATAVLAGANATLAGHAAISAAEHDRWLQQRGERLLMFREEDDWKNTLALFWMPDGVRARLPRIVQSWLRNYIFCMAVYCIVGGLWAYYIYACYGTSLFPAGNMPVWHDMAEQIRVSMASIPLYSALPAVFEWLVERGWTRVHPRVADVGLLRYLLHFVAYMACVEFLVYWSHRSLHDMRIGYRLLHNIHHKYNKENTLSPFAGLAFHPLDGIIQALPYCWMLFVVPMHFLTFELLLFTTGIWTTNIHDCIHGRMEPIMGAGYHTIHHTTYRHNYGSFFVYCDWLHGTLLTPEEHEQQQQGKATAVRA